MPTKEHTYDTEIRPLMDRIIAICQRENIGLAASFQLDTHPMNGPLLVATVIPVTPWQDLSEELALMAAIINHGIRVVEEDGQTRFKEAA